MAHPDDKDDLEKFLAAAHSAASDVGFGGPEDDAEEFGAKFKADYSETFTDADGKTRTQEFDTSGTRSGSAGARAADEAEFVDIRGPSVQQQEEPSPVEADGLSEDAEESFGTGQAAAGERDKIDEYLDTVKIWKEAGVDFVNDADMVDQIKHKRLRLAAEIAAEPHLIVDKRMQQVEAYYKADCAYNNRPDPGSIEYSEFVQERNQLRDKIFRGRALETSDDYVKFARRTQNMLLEPNPADQHIMDQYDLIDLRREAVLQHYDDPRFIAEVARHPAGVFDELLVDLDRADLLITTDDKATLERSRVMGDIFTDTVEESLKLGRGSSVVEKAKSFQEMREVGRSVRHNQRAIVNFASGYEEGAKGYELGMAALEDNPWNDAMFQRWVKDMPRADRALITEENRSAGTFLAARRQFEKQFDAGDPRAGESFAIMEQAAGVLLKHPHLQRRLSEIGDLDTIAALQVFSQSHLNEHVAGINERVEADIISRMGDVVVKNGERAGRADGLQEDGESYLLDLNSGRVSVAGKLPGNSEDALESLGKSLSKDNARPETMLALARVHAEVAGNEELLAAVQSTGESFAALDPGEKQAALRSIGEIAGKFPSSHQLGVMLNVDTKRMGRSEFKDLVTEGVASADHSEMRKLGSAMRAQSDMAGAQREIGLSLTEREPSFEVVDGCHLRIANSRKDLEDGKGLVLRLDGIVAPPEGTQTKNGNFDAGVSAKAHLEEIIHRHGVASLGFQVQTLASGEKVLKARLSTGEDASLRMLRDGYAQPTKDSIGGDMREWMTKQSRTHERGLWREGFPDMDQSWRREKGTPEMTWRDKRLNLTRNVAEAMALETPSIQERLGLSKGKKQKSAYAMLSRSEQRLFALPVQTWAGDKRIDDEILKAVKANPDHIKDIYQNNMEILTDLRKRKDKLTKDEKVAHDRLTLGARALGNALVAKNMLDGKEHMKNDAELMSREGISISADGVRIVTKPLEAAAGMVSGSSKKALESIKRDPGKIFRMVIGD